MPEQEVAVRRGSTSKPLEMHKQTQSTEAKAAPPLGQSLQLQALRRELEAAEMTVSELKRLISELEP